MRSPIMALILVVDDSPQIRRMVRFTVEHHGHRILEAEDGRAAWRVLAAERADLVILDVLMPGPSGLEVCRAIRADPQIAATPVIILTAGGGPGDEDDALGAGASAFVAKPFRPSALLDLVTALTDGDRWSRDGIM
jgi:CheY-like chemotaxis protein